MNEPILVVGIPRSGTTWVAHTLARVGDAAYLEEPDNHFRRPYAFKTKRRLARGEYPTVSRHESPGEYETLWQQALTPDDRPLAQWRVARRRTSSRLLASISATDISSVIAGRSRPSMKLRVVESLASPERPPREAERLVAKSVYASLSIEWIADRFRPNVIVVIRHPLNVVSSWSYLGWLARTRDDMLDELHPSARADLAAEHAVAVPDATDSPVLRATWLAAALTCSLISAARRHPTWHVVSHGALCSEPHEGFAGLARTVGIRWTPAADELVRSLDRNGSGYEIRRVASELGDVWRRRLTDEEAREAIDVIERFPHAETWTA